MQPKQPNAGPPTQPVQPVPTERASSALGSGLRCASCQYTLDGLSIRALCPECGLPIQVTILAVVDPHADRLAPLLYPRRLVASLWLWSLGGLAACAVVAMVRAHQFAFSLAPWWKLAPPTQPALWVALAIALVALGSLGMRRPIASRPARHVRRCDLAALALALASIVSFFMLGPFDGARPPPLQSLATSSPMRSVLRLVIAALACAALVGVRSNLRLLAARSLLFRQGRADRQTIYALCAAFGVAAVGDVLHLVASLASGPLAELLWSIGLAVIAVGSCLIVLGCVAVAVDTAVVSAAILRPHKGLDHYLARSIGGTQPREQHPGHQHGASP